MTIPIRKVLEQVTLSRQREPLWEERMLGNRRTLEDISETLYHGTDIRSLLCILYSDSLSGKEDMDHGPTGPSLTSEYKVASDFADNVQELIREDDYPLDYERIPDGDVCGGVLQIDGQALVTAGYDIRPFVWDARCSPENEERVIGDVKELSRFMRALFVDDADIDWHRQLFIGGGDEEMVRLCDQLRDHPLRRERIPELAAAVGL